MKYLMIVSRDPGEYRSFDFVTNLAKDLSKKGNEVHFYLLENGVFAAKKGNDHVANSLRGNGVKLYAEDVSLTVRGLNGKTSDGLKVSNLDELVDLMMEKTDKVMWY